MEPTVTSPVVDRLIEKEIFRCGACHAPLRRAADGSLVCDTGHDYPPKHGVLDLYARCDASPGDAPRDAAQDAVISALADRLALARDDLLAAELFEPLEKTGNGFFDAEENIFLDRFEFANVAPRLTVRKVYSSGKMQAGETHWLAVRVENASPFVISSSGAKPVLLSYHWLNDDGSVRLFDGRRTALPVDVKPGQAVTAHVAVDAPADVAHLRLKVLPVHEYVSWLEDDGETLEIEFTSGAAMEPPRFDAGRPFSEDLDNELSQNFLDRHLSRLADPVCLEIGGGLIASLSRWMWAMKKSGTVINSDVSVRLLRVAALLSAKGADPVTAHCRFDANNMPVRDGALDAAAFSRSLHHFEDPIRVLRECHRVLKPGGLLFLLCEPVAVIYDEPTKALIRMGVNEQMFPFDAYEAMIDAASFECVDAACDWGFSLKAALRKKG